MQCIRNLSAVLTEAGSSLSNVVRVGVFLTDMENFAAMNRVYETMFREPRPVSLILLLSTLGGWRVREEGDGERGDGGDGEGGDGEWGVGEGREMGLKLIFFARYLSAVPVSQSRNYLCGRMLRSSVLLICR